MANPVMIVAGVGPGLGAAVGRRFGRGGYDVALIARTEETVTRVGTSLQEEGITAGWTAVDMTDDDEFRRAIERFAGHAGGIDALHFNPSAFTPKSALELSPAELLADVHLGVASFLTAVQAARPFMSKGGRITATGSRAADHPWAEGASLGVQKAGLRNLVSALDITLAPSGIRAASLTVNGTIGSTAAFAPDRIADAIFELAATSDDAWQSHVVYDG